MILSHKYKFIFLKTYKTAGTSIEIALSKFCGDQDIITPISPVDEKTRLGIGYRGPQNYLAPLSDCRLKDLLDLVTKRKRKKRFYNHISARKVKGYIGDKIWKEYYKFCFERNPWDRVISLYYWRNKSEPRPTIQEFLESELPLLRRRRGFELYTINGEIAVDKVCLYENLAENLEQIRVLLGLPEPLVLPRAKSSYREDKRHYRDIFDHESREKIEKLFAQEIEIFDYKF